MLFARPGSVNLAVSPFVRGFSASPPSTSGSTTASTPSTFPFFSVLRASSKSTSPSAPAVARLGESPTPARVSLNSSPPAGATTVSGPATDTRISPTPLVARSVTREGWARVSAVPATRSDLSVVRIDTVWPPRLRVGVALSVRLTRSIVTGGTVMAGGGALCGSSSVIMKV